MNYISVAAIFTSGFFAGLSSIVAWGSWLERQDRKRSERHAKYFPQWLGELDRGFEATRARLQKSKIPQA